MQEVDFVAARDGGVMARWEGKVAFPERHGKQPQAGETWECEKVGENPRGTVVFLRCLQKAPIKEEWINLEIHVKYAHMRHEQWIEIQGRHEYIRFPDLVLPGKYAVRYEIYSHRLEVGDILQTPEQIQKEREQVFHADDLLSWRLGHKSCTPGVRNYCETLPHISLPLRCMCWKNGEGFAILMNQKNTVDGHVLCISPGSSDATWDGSPAIVYEKLPKLATGQYYLRVEITRNMGAYYENPSVSADERTSHAGGYVPSQRVETLVFEGIVTPEVPA